MEAVYNFALEKATRERDKFLEEHPELQAMQDELIKDFDVFGDDPVANMEIIVNAVEVRRNMLMHLVQEVKDEIASR